MLAQAAMHDMGVALIPPFLIERELAEERLCIAHPHSCRSDRAYHLIIPERRTESATLNNLRDWLLQQARSYREQGTSPL